MTLFPKEILSRKPDTHKGDYGHVLVVSGSIGLTGAPVFTALAALRSGAGLVSLGVPESVYFIVASKLNEVMVYPLPETVGGGLSHEALAALKPLIAKADVLAVGPGLSQNAVTSAAVRTLVVSTELPVVLDADGVNAFSGIHHRQLLKVKGPVVVTPHPGEMARLLGVTAGSVQRDRFKTAKEAAREMRVVVVLKGHKTVVASPAGKTYVNETGNPGMASAGMGDLLTGMIAALIGQGMDPFSAAKAGVHLHGLAGDIAVREVGEAGLIATDVLEAIPAAFRAVRSAVK